MISKREENNFGLLRLLAAMAVIFSHCYTLRGFDSSESFRLLNGFVKLGTFSVYIFFILSGYLITKSWFSSKKPLFFLSKRVLRIFPGYIFAILGTIFVMGPLFTDLPLHQYFSAIEIKEYFKNIGMFIAPMYYYLPGVFTTNPYPLIVNGSLWSLPLEFMMYLSILILGVTKVLNKAYLIIGVFLILLYGYWHLLPTLKADTSFLFIPIAFILQYGLYFYMGSIFYLFREKIVWDKTIAFAFLIVWILSFKMAWFETLNLLALPYLILYIVFNFNNRVTSYLARLTRKIDLSYGIYIYAFPVQQILVHHYANKIGLWALFFLSLFITSLLAFLSWCYIESPALRIKNKLNWTTGLGKFINLSFLRKSLQQIKNSIQRVGAEANDF